MNSATETTLTDADFDLDVMFPVPAEEPEVLDFADMPVSVTRPLITAPEVTADDARVAREARSAEFRAAWHEEHATAAKPRG